MRNFNPLISHFATLFMASLFAFPSCNLPESKTTASPTLSDFPNVLNYKGLPESASDRSVFVFSDMGAWHAWALPVDSNAQLRGSFVGPFLLTQDNGTWLSPYFSRMEITDTETGRIINFDDAVIVENSAYPNKLQQVLETTNPKLRITSELIFVSSRSSLIRVSIQNLNIKESANLQIVWKGESWLEDVEMEKSENGISVLTKNQLTRGWICTDSFDKQNANVHGGEYEISNPIQVLEPGQSFSTHLGHSFGFTAEEIEMEQDFLQTVFENPASFFDQNTEIWNHKLESVFDNLKPEFSSPAYRKIAVKCLETLNNNWRSAAGFLSYDGLFPSYNYKWFNGFWAWDSWKHAVALTRYNADLAKDQIRAMYDFQDKDGMIADCIYRDTLLENHNWRNTKPPLSAWAVWEVFRSSGDTNFVAELFAKIENQHRWWYQYRDHNQNGLCEYGSTDGTLIAAKWESGMDNAVRFDNSKIHKNSNGGWSLNQESVDLNAYLFAEKGYLAQLAEVLGKSKKAQNYRREAALLQEKINTTFWDETSGWYFDYNTDTQSLIKILGSEGWIPLFTKLATSQQAAAMHIHMTDTPKFATHIPFPTLAADDSKFKPNGGYWRGPIWLDQTYFAIKGLKNYGYTSEAKLFTNQVLDRLEGLKDSDLPIRENYHPLTGAGLESYHFSWSAAHILLLMQEDGWQ